ncbi:homoprotocatechuate catabolism bifunctional isomerase/decarboxylase [Rhodococcus erythropolis]|nr:homoprotocatechuate catabolism bifunctional isomerase/decarboxylase [Rhodococcus erythropolis]
MEMIATVDGLGRVNGDCIELLSTEFSDLAEPLRAGLTLDDVGTYPVRDEIAYSDAKIITPLGRGAAIWGVGSNYPRAGKASTRHGGLPTFFMKAPTSLVDPHATIWSPGAMATEFDYEGEVAVVVGKPSFDVSEYDAWSHIAAIAAANDSTARDVMTVTGNPVLAKSFPEIAAIGPTLLPMSSVVDREDITVKSWVNGELRQDSSTAHLIYSIPELFSLLSRFVRLAPGDVLLTGGPEGRGVDSGRFLAADDIVSISVGGLRPLTNSVRSRSSTRTIQELVKEK